ncbi:haloacid dehalogenase type II [Streptomyces triticagri]|uniref:Haloacid dehalogenase type II n=1 Tax=Streptomyces triticagri TaxID=2293568 RepID=A0A372LXV2_9ACTN|nr:haloacid dehalogenase type II [Streptomyces triticagri]RFU83125.1 haloacid dehalogenase type II [Streptomyces triticagri]
MTMTEDIDVVVFDILGTMVDEPGGLRTALGAELPTADDDHLDALVAQWQQYAEHEQQRIAAGRRPYANSELIDREAAERIAAQAGVEDPDAVTRLVARAQRPAPWADSVATLARMARSFPVLGLSNASRAALLRLNAHAGLRWHLALSAENAQAYKPRPEVYRLALDAVRTAPERVLMVAAHAWDLRGAQTLGLRTAYVPRPAGDPPTDSDAFDLTAHSLDDLMTTLTGGPDQAVLHRS